MPGTVLDVTHFSFEGARHFSRCNLLRQSTAVTTQLPASPARAYPCRALFVELVKNNGFFDDGARETSLQCADMPGAANCLLYRPSCDSYWTLYAAKPRFWRRRLAQSATAVPTIDIGDDAGFPLTVRHAHPSGSVGLGVPLLLEELLVDVSLEPLDVPDELGEVPGDCPPKPPLPPKPPVLAISPMPEDDELDDVEFDEDELPGSPMISMRSMWYPKFCVVASVTSRIVTVSPGITTLSTFVAVPKSI